MSRLHDVILRPIVTEKTAFDTELYNKVSFKVSRKATKAQIRHAIEELFGVEVVKVNTANMPGKPKRFGRTISRRPGYKKAVITLAEGSTLDLFDAGDEFDGEEDEFGPEDFADEAMEN